MKAYFHALSCMTLCAAIAACSATVDPTNPYDPAMPADQQARGKVTGSISLERGQDPTGTLVTLEGTSNTAQAGATGEFTLTQVPAGTYTLVATKDGFRAQHQFGVTVKVGATTDAGAISLLLWRGTVRGQVTIRNASDSGGATVSLPQVAKAPPPTDVRAAPAPDSTAPSFVTVSASDGRWEIPDVYMGQYYLVISKEGYQTRCGGLLTLETDGEEKAAGVLELISTSALVTFASEAGADLPVREVNGAAVVYTNARTLVAKFTAAGAVQMRTAWSEAGLAGAKWESFAVSKGVVIDAQEPDGEKTLWVDLEDQCHLTQRYSFAVTLDTTPPAAAPIVFEGAVQSGGSYYTRSQSVTLSFSATDALSGVEKMVVAADGDLTGKTAVPYETRRADNLTAGDGLKTVLVKFIDAAGNESDPVSATITLDTTPPDGAAVAVTGKRTDPVSGGSVDDPQLSRTVDVKLVLSANGAAKAAVSNDAALDCATAQYVPVTFDQTGTAVIPAFTLTGGTGLKTVYACFADDAGNVSTRASGTIYLDQEPPVNVGFQINAGDAYTQSATVALNAVVASDNRSEQMYYMASNCYDFGAGAGCDTTGWLSGAPGPMPWSHAAWTLTPADGAKKVFLKVRDWAGNESAVASAAVTLDQTDPDPPTALAAPGKPGGGTYYIGTTTPSVSWAASVASDADHYELQYRKVGDAAWQTGSTPSTGFTLPALSEHEYEWQVRTVDHAGRTSAWVSGTDFVVDVTPPTTPRFETVAQTILDLDDATGNEMKMALTVLSTDANFRGYQIRGGILTDFTDTTPDAQSRVTFNLVKDAVNTLQVRAIDLAGNASSADFVIITEDSTPPDPPASVTVHAGNKRMYLDWQPSPSKDVAGYRVYYGFSRTPPFNGTFAAEGASPIDVGKATSFGLSSLVNGNDFWVTVTTYDQTQNVVHESSMPAAQRVLPNLVTPEVVGTYKTPGHATAVQIAGSLAYVADGPGGLQIISIADPAHPKARGSLATQDNANDVVVRGSVAYVAAGGAGLLVVDVSDPSNPALLGSYDTPGYSHQVAVGENTAYVADGPGGLQIVDVANPKAPSFKGSFMPSSGDVRQVGVSDRVNLGSDPSGQGMSGYAIGTVAVINDGDTSVLLLDVSDPAAPTMLESVASQGNLHKLRFEHNGGGPAGQITSVQTMWWGTESGLFMGQITGSSSQAVTSFYHVDPASIMLGEWGVFSTEEPVVDLRKPQTPLDAYFYLALPSRLLVLGGQNSDTEVGEVALSGQPEGLDVSGTIACVAAGDTGIQVIEIASPSTPETKIEVPSPDTVTGVRFDGTVMMKADSSAGGFSFIYGSPAVMYSIGLDSSGQSNNIQLTVSGTTAYVSNGNKGLYTIDISDLAHPALKNIYTDGIQAGTAFVSGTRLYVNGSWMTGQTSQYSAYWVMDVSNPAAPALICRKAMSSNGTILAVSGSTAYHFWTQQAGASGVDLVDMSDCANPVVKSTIAMSGSWPPIVVVSGTRAIFSYSYMVSVYDVSDATTPQLVGTYAFPGSYGNDIAISGDNLYVASSSGFWVVDISTPHSQTCASSGTDCSGPFGTGSFDKVRVSGTHLILSAGDGTLKVYDLSVSPPAFSSTLTPGPGVSGLEVAWPHVFTVQTQSGGVGWLSVFDASNLSSGGPLSTFHSECQAPGFDVASPFVYSACGRSGLFIFDALGFKSWFRTAGTAENAFAHGNLVFVAEGDAGIEIVDVTDSYHPVLKGSVSTGTHVYDVHVEGRHAYAVAGNAGVHVIDVSDPAHPAVKGTYVTPGFARRVIGREGSAYVAAGSAGLQILDVSDPAHPTLKGAYNTPGTANGVFVSGVFVYVADGNEGLQIIDATDPSTPVLKAKLGTPGTAWDVVVAGDEAYVADGNHGVQVIRIEP